MFSPELSTEKFLEKRLPGVGAGGGGCQAFFPPLTGYGIVCGENEASGTR